MTKLAINAIIAFVVVTILVGQTMRQFRHPNPWSMAVASGIAGAAMAASATLGLWTIVL